jgi:tetratricopeptide (TPR) repeat protein
MPYRIPLSLTLVLFGLIACTGGVRPGAQGKPGTGAARDGRSPAADAPTGAGSGSSPGSDTLLADLLAEPSGPDADRAEFGRLADPPFWSPLTAPEVQALRGRNRAAGGDPAALLDLAILASGDRRETGEYAAIRARVAEFTLRMRPKLAAEKDARKRGARLHAAMHAAFFPKRRATEDGGFGAGYDWGQSKLTGIFADGKYNCVSSAMLFLVLARESGMDAKGVVLLSHVFAQLTLPDGAVVEVETTSPDGYGAVHDKAFYRKQARGWFTSRGLPASTYRDYRERKIVSPLELAAFNMANQHTGSDRMALKDRRRLFEARAFIDPGNRDAQANRLAFLSAEYKALSDRGDWKSLDRMYRLLAGSLPALRRAWEGDPELANHIAWLPFSHANTLYHLGRNDEALRRIDSSLAWLRPDASEGAKLKSNNASLLILITRDMAGKGEYPQAEARLLRYPELLRDDANLRTQMTWIGQEHALRAWKREDWQAAADLFAKSLRYSPEEYRKPIRENLAAAYFNMAVTLRNAGQDSQARAILEKCRAEVPDVPKCRE